MYRSAKNLADIAFHIVHGGWSEWGPWRPCQCDVDVRQEKHRSCTNPVPLGEYARDCIGQNYDRRFCRPLPDCTDGR